MRCRSLLRPSLASLLLLSLAACPGDDSGGTGGGTETGTETSTGTGDATMGLDSTGGASSGDTGEPSGIDLAPCDPLAEASCDEGVCAGHPISGFYCRPGCSSMAEAGTPCGSDDICLPVRPGAMETACFDVRECDLPTGEGCNLAAGDSCAAVSLEPLLTACVPAGEAGSGQACAPAGMLACGPGFACLGSDLDAGSDGLCTGWCEPGAPLPAECSACAALGDAVGTCSECTVLDDQCPDGAQCQLANELLGGVCVGVGPGGPGSPCSPFDEAQSCQDGLLCVDLDADEDVPICLPSCDPARPMCEGEGESCLDVGVFVPGAPSGQLGVCLAVGVTLCDPMAEPTDCAADENCFDVGAGLGICGATCDPAQGDTACLAPNTACFPSDGSQIDLAPFLEGNGACGLGCSTDLECGGATCLHLDGLDVAGLCGATCTPGMPGTCAAGQACVATPEDAGVGACMIGGTTCNTGNVGECGGAACIPMEGEPLVGICLPQCFGQDPAACGGAPALCQPKSDPTWHEGTCIGGGTACNPIVDDCGPGRACGVVGGSAFGGHAFLCDDAGPLSEGGDCSMEGSACGAGLGCISGVCRAWCDPAADACATGTCIDISASLYLPADSLGACL
jgi:hypothetical protein